MNKALGGTGGIATKKHSQKQQQTGLTRELMKIQQGSRPVVILDGPRNSRLRSSISSMESSPANTALEKYRQEAGKKASTAANKELKEANEPVKKARTGEPKPFEKLLASAANSNNVLKATAASVKNPIETIKPVNRIIHNTMIEEEDVEIGKPFSKQLKSKSIIDSFENPIQQSFTATSNEHTRDRSTSANVFIY